MPRSSSKSLPAVVAAVSFLATILPAPAAAQFWPWNSPTIPAPAPTVPAPTRQPTPKPPTLPTGGNYLNYIDKEPEWLLGKCEGDCDRDEDCQGSLVCFRIPKDFTWGCAGKIEKPGKHHYCMDLNEVPPTMAPTPRPTPQPTPRPTPKPTPRPTPSPTRQPSASPSASPTARPSASPSASPTAQPSASPSASPTSMPSSSPTVPDKLYMDFDPIWVEVTFPMGMRPAQVFGDGQPFSTIDSDSEDGGAVELVAGSVQPRGRGFGAQDEEGGNDNGEDVILDRGDEDEEFSTLGTLSRNQIKIMASYIDNIVTGVVNDQMPLINYYYWEAYLDTKLTEKVTLYPQGVPAKGQGEKGAAMRLEADLRGETQMVLRYEVTGQYSFVNITDTVLPSKMDVRTATAEALNANVLYRELRRSEHPMLSELELLTVNWADYGTNDASRTYKILGSVIFIMLLGLLGGIGYVYHKRAGNRKSRSGLIIDENDNASSWFSGDESSIRRLSSWREGNDKTRGKTTEVSPGKTANSEMSRSFVSDGDLDASGMVSIPHGDAEESIISSIAPAGPMGVAKAKWNAFAARAFGRGEIISDSGSSAHEMDMSSRYYDDEPSIMPSELDESAIIEDASSVGDMTKFTKFTYQDIAKRKDVDLLDTCDPNAIDESVTSQEESNTSLPHAYQIDQPTVPSDGEATTTLGENGLASTVDPSLIQSEQETVTEIGERGADVSLLVSEADFDMPTVEQVATEKATDTPNGNEISAKNQIKATFASLWHKKKKDTPSKKFRYTSSRQTKAAVVVTNAQPQPISAGGAADHDQASEVGSCREHPYINVSDDMSLISALSIGGVSTITAGTGVRSIPTASKEVNLMPAMDAVAAADDLHQSIALQEDAILEVDSEESSNEGSKKSEQVDDNVGQTEPLEEQLEPAAPEQSDMEPQQSETTPHMLAQPSSQSEPESSAEEEISASDAPNADEASVDEEPFTTEVPRSPLYPQEPEEAESSDSEAENDDDESDAESDFPAEALEAKPIENQGDGSTVGYENIAPMEEESTVGSNGIDPDKIVSEEAGRDILDNSDDHSVPTVYEEEDDMPNKSMEQPSFAEASQSEPPQALGSESAEQEATPLPTEEAADTIVPATDDKVCPEEEDSTPTPQFEIDADIKDALESKPSGESSEDELDGEIRSAVEECSMISESDEDDDAESTTSSSSSTSSLIQEIVPNASPKKSPKRPSQGGEGSNSSS